MSKIKYEYKLQDIIKDNDGNFIGHIGFEYGGKLHLHEFVYNRKDKESMSIDYGWKVPGLVLMWESIEAYLKNYKPKIDNRKLVS